MKSALLILAALLVAVSALQFNASPCHISKGKPISHVVSPLPHTYMNLANLPDSFDWRNSTGVNLVTVSRNQHLPQYCGSCWAFAATASLSDRLKIARAGAWPDFNLAPQVLLNCGSDAGTCNGGSSDRAFEYIRLHGIPDETCAPYQAKDLDCTPENVCKNCGVDIDDPTAECGAVQTPTLYYVDEHGSVSGEANMQAEILARGPIACGVAVTEAFEEYSGGIFVDTTGTTSIDHVISIVGWGEENGTPYWIVRNSWGTFWGERGFARVMRGNNTLAIETSCTWATPKI